MKPKKKNGHRPYGWRLTGRKRKLPNGREMVLHATKGWRLVPK